MILKREGTTVWKVSRNDKNLILRNFLPVKNESLFEQSIEYLQNYFDNNTLIDISSLRQEKNGTLILDFKSQIKYGIYSTNKGYVRTIKLSDKIFSSKESYSFLNSTIKLNDESDSFYESVEPIDCFGVQLYTVVRHIIFNN